MAVSEPHNDIAKWAKKDVEEKREILSSLEDDVKELERAGVIEKKEGSKKSVKDIDLLAESVYWIGRQINRGEEIDKEIVKDAEHRRNDEEILEHLESELAFNYTYLFIFEEVSQELASTVADVDSEELNKDKEEVESLLKDVAQKINQAEKEINKEIETEKRLIKEKFGKGEKVFERAKQEGQSTAKGFINDR